MNLKKANWVNIALVVLIGVLIFTPLMSYVKRNLFPNNEIEVTEKQPLNDQSYTLELKGYNCENINLEQTKGKVTFLHFWGTWCPDCNLEMPSVQEFYNAHGKEIAFILVDIERDDNYKKLRSYIDKKNYTVPMYEPVSPISKQLQVEQFPTTFIIDKEGNIVSKHVGATDWKLIEVQQPILNLLN